MTRDWNAERYHDVSTPQQTWGRRVLDRVSLAGSERALDLGCGTGHLTSLLAARLPHGRVTGLDRSAAMTMTAASWLRDQAPRVTLVLADGAALPFIRASFDVVFSNATFHWIHDHDALFASIFGVLAPGGRLLAQCGGGPNVERLHRRSERLMRQPRFAPFFRDWVDPWHFADVPTTEQRLTAAGFADIDVGLEEAPTSFASATEYEEFISTVCVRHHLSHLDDVNRSAFLSTLTTDASEDDPSFTLDYWRLNISARRPV